MDQSEVKLNSLFRDFVKSNKKPSVQLQKLLQNLDPQDIPDFLVDLSVSFCPYTQGKKIYQILKIVAGSKKSKASIASSPETLKQVAQLVFKVFNSTLTKNASVQHNDQRVRFLRNLRGLFGEDLLFQAFGSSLQKDQRFLPLTQWCIEFSKSKKHDQFKKLLIDKLREDTLLDLKNQKENGLKFSGNFVESGLLTEEDVFNIIETAENLLKRSDSNIEVLVQILEELAKTKIDLSKVIKRFVEQTLSEFLGSNNYLQAIKSLQLAGQRTKDPSLGSYLLGVATKGISKTNDENKKFAFFALLKCVSGILRNIEDEVSKQKLQTESIEFLIANANIILKDDQLNQIILIINDIFKYGASEFTLGTGLINSLKKIAGVNRYTSTVTNVIILNYIPLHKAQLTEQAQFNELIESIFNSSVAQNLKNFEVTVSQPLMFLTGLKVVLLYLMYCEDDAPSKLIANIHKEIQKKQFEIFYTKSHFSSLKYLIATSEIESQLIGEVHLLLYSIYNENFSEQELKYKFEYFTTLFTLISFSSKTSNKFRPIYEQVIEILKKKENGQAQFLLDVFFSLRWYVYSINPMKHVDIQFRNDRLNNFMQYLVRLIIDNINEDQDFLQGIPGIDDVLFTLNHPFFSQKWSNLILKTIKKHNIEENVLNQLLELPTSKPYFWISGYGLASQNRYSPQGIKNFTNFLVKLGARAQMIEGIEEIMVPDNLNQNMSLETVNENCKTFVENYESNDDPKINQILQATGLAFFLNNPVEEEEDPDTQRFLQKESKRGAIQLMDESEAAEQVSKQHKHQFALYYMGFLQYAPCFLNAKEWFMEEYFNQISLVTKLPEVRIPFTRFALKLLRSFPITESAAVEIVELLIERAKGQSHLSRKALDKIFKFEQSILEKGLPKGLMTIVHHIHLYLLENNDFEQRFKQSAMRFILKSTDQNFISQLLPQYYEIVVKNINICAHVPECFDLINLLLKDKAQEIISFLQEILNLAEEAQTMALRCLNVLDPAQIPLELGVAVKLRVLIELGGPQTQQQAKLLVEKLPHFDQYLTTLKDWDFTEYARKHAREHLEVSIKTLSQSKIDWKIYTEKVLQAASELESKLEEEQLLFFPYWAQLCVEQIPQSLVPQAIDILTGNYSRQESRQLLVRAATDAGISVIKFWGPKCGTAILAILEKYMKSSKQVIKGKPQQQQAAKTNQRTTKSQEYLNSININSSDQSSSSISAVIFLGVLSPSLQTSKDELLSVQKQIMVLLRSSPRPTQVNLAKCLGSLLVFFPNAESIVEQNFEANRTEADPQIKLGVAFLCSGLLRGLGIQSLESLKILERIDEQSGGKKEQLEEKLANLFMCEALVEIFGRLIEPYVPKVMSILMKYFGDGREEVRKSSLNGTRLIMNRLTGYGVKNVLPFLFQGIEESRAWRSKISNIWALGNMAHCSPKQLSSCLPVIVSCISRAISDTHPQVRQSANESLELIGSTIQNPEISEISNILIQSLSNPFDQNLQGLQVILETRFAHYIDAPALSLLIPIIDYGLRSLDSEQKQLASKLVGCLPILIKNEGDLVPYMDMIVGGLEVALGDPLIEVRSLAAKAIGQLSTKIGEKNTEKYFKFVWDILNSQDIAAIKRSGAANSLAEISCSLGVPYFESSLQKIFEQIQRPEPYIKEGYVGSFIYMPGIMQNNFEEYVKDILDNIQELVSHDEDNVRNITLRVLKILIQNYAITLNELLYPTLNKGMSSDGWKLRNASVILSGEMLSMSQPIMKKQLDNPMNPQYLNIELYNTNLMLLYIMRQDDVEQVRQNASQIWKGYIDNTPRAVKRGLKYMVISLAIIISSQALYMTADNTIQNFCHKYGETHLQEFLNIIEMILTEKGDDLNIVRGAYNILLNLYKYTDFDVINKYKTQLLQLTQYFILSQEHLVKLTLFQSVGILVNKLKSTQFLEDLIKPYLDTLHIIDETDPNYEVHLEIFDLLCELNSPLILTYLLILILEPPFEQYKIDILTNNARTFAKVMYTQQNSVYPMHVLFEELLSNLGKFKLDHAGKIEWENRTQSLVYCINQLSVHLTRDGEDNVSHFAKDIIIKVDDYSKLILEGSNENINELIVSLELLSYFLLNTFETFFELNPRIIGKIIPFTFLINPKLTAVESQLLIELSNKILQGVNNTIDKEKHFENINTIYTCFFNRINAPQFTKVIPGLNQPEGYGVEPYVEMIINCLVYGDDTNFSQAVEFFHMLLQYTEIEYLQIYILKLSGALIRVLNYHLNYVQKVKSLEVLLLIQKLNLDLSQFSIQLAVTYQRILNKINTEADSLKLVAANYSELFKYHKKRDFHLLEIWNKTTTAPNELIRNAYLRVIKVTLRDNATLFSRALVERIFCLSRQFFDRIIIEDSCTPSTAAYLGYIAGTTYQFSSVKNQEKFNKNPTNDYQLLMLTSFVGAPKSDTNLAETLYEKAIKLFESKDIFVINQAVKNLQRLKLLGLKGYISLDFNQIIDSEIVQESQLLQETMVKLKI